MALTMAAEAVLERQRVLREKWLNRNKKLERRNPLLRDLCRLQMMIERAGQPVPAELDELTSKGWN